MKKVRSRQTSTRKQPSASRMRVRLWLVVVDEAPIRAAYLRQYLKLEKKLEDTRQQLRAFETGDVPAYQRWEAQVLGQLLTEFRQTEAEYTEKTLLLNELEQEMYWGRCSRREAYDRVMARRASGEKADRFRDDEDDEVDDFSDVFGDGETGEENDGGRIFGARDLPPDFDVDRFDACSKSEKKIYRESWEQIAMLYQVMTGNEVLTFEELVNEERRRKREKGRAEKKASAGVDHEDEEPEKDLELNSDVRKEKDPVIDRIKDLYRRLVRELHPDVLGGHTQREGELWLQLQVAYNARDLEQMEAVAGRMEIGREGVSDKMPIQILKRMAKELLLMLNGMRAATSAAKKSPAWQFRTRGANLAKYEAKRRSSLMMQQKQMKSNICELDRYLEQFTSTPVRKAPKKKTKAEKSKVAASVKTAAAAKAPKKAARGTARNQRTPKAAPPPPTFTKAEQAEFPW